MKSIGGYFELELSKGSHYHLDVIQLNLGRSCLEYILRANLFRCIYVPHFTCAVLFDMLDTLNIIVKKYEVNELLEPDFDFNSIGDDELFMYTNYFGLKDAYVSSISRKVKNLVIDNCQSFYSSTIQGISAFYSPRKFFGVPDGAYLSTGKPFKSQIEKDISVNRLKHLVGRLEYGPQKAFENFKQNEESLNHVGLKEMSVFTEALLKSIDYEAAANIRNKNYRYLHQQLGNSNKLKISFDLAAIPLVYPYISEQEGLRSKLINNQVFVATYWPNVLAECDSETLDYYFAKNILPLPIDQRYCLEDMKSIVALILE